jgi:hypothetical protein
MPTREIIRITVSKRTDGADIAQCAGFECISKRGAEMGLARLLVAAGFPDTGWQTEAAGRVRLFGPSLHGLARLTVSETDARRIGIVKWTPMLERPVAKAA